jgi:hypothetical protein
MTSVVPFLFTTKQIFTRCTNMIVLTTSTSAQTFSFIPRFENYTTMTITDEQTNVTTTVAISSSTQGGYVNTITATFALVDNHTYTLLLSNGTTICHKDKVFCTNQSIATFSVNDGQYTSNATTNTFIVYE